MTVPGNKQASQIADKPPSGGKPSGSQSQDLLAVFEAADFVNSLVLAFAARTWHISNMHVTIAVSGGVDSLYALLALREAGHSVRALHGLFLPRAAADPVPGLTALCRSLDVELRLADLTAPFERAVIAPFAAEYRRARTPNPCALCNREIKFGSLLALALKQGDALATGHYAALAEHPVYGRALCAGADKGKDQSYFLALTPLRNLRRCLFPLAAATKTDIRAWLEQRGVTPPLRGESQEVCFVPGNDYRAWLERRGTDMPGPGPVLLVDRDGRERHIGKHQGLWRHTEGQRKGLGIAWSEPLFVLGRDRSRNALLVGTNDRALSRFCRVDKVNFLVEPALWPARLLVRTRYRQEALEAEVVPQGTALAVTFAAPQPPVAPGQVAAVYDADGFVLAGGVLE